jgi:predicted nucleic acid-binding protein
MYLWDANILRHCGQGHATLRLYLLRVSWAEIALPAVVVAEVRRGIVYRLCRKFSFAGICGMISPYDQR